MNFTKDYNEITEICERYKTAIRGGRHVEAGDIIGDIYLKFSNNEFTEKQLKAEIANCVYASIKHNAIMRPPMVTKCIDEKISNKQCRKCLDIKPIEEFNPHMRDGTLRSANVCRDCIRTQYQLTHPPSEWLLAIRDRRSILTKLGYLSGNRKRLFVPFDEKELFESHIKKCKTCPDKKTLEEFYIKYNLDENWIASSYCKKCEKELALADYYKNADTKRKTANDYKKIHPLKCLQYKKTYRAKHISEIRERSKIESQLRRRKNNPNLGKYMSKEDRKIYYNNTKEERAILKKIKTKEYRRAHREQERMATAKRRREIKPTMKDYVPKKINRLTESLEWANKIHCGLINTNI